MKEFILILWSVVGLFITVYCSKNKVHTEFSNLQALICVLLAGPLVIAMSIIVFLLVCISCLILGFWDWAGKINF